MWFENKQTGLKWEINDNEVVERLINDENYTVVNEEKVEKQEKIDLESLGWKELRQIAIEKNINTHAIKKDELIKILKEMGV